MKKEYKEVFDINLNTACRGILGFAVKKLAPTKENLKKFNEQFSTGPLCSCVGCMELAKTFILDTHSAKEAVITASMDDLKIK